MRKRETFKGISSSLYFMGEKFGYLPSELKEIYDTDPWKYGFDLEVVKIGVEMEKEIQEENLDETSLGEMKEQDVTSYVRLKRKHMERMYG